MSPFPCPLLRHNTANQQFDSLVEHGDPGEALLSSRSRRAAAKSRGSSGSPVDGRGGGSGGEGGPGGGRGGRETKRRRAAAAVTASGGTQGLKPEAIPAMKKVRCEAAQLAVWLSGRVIGSVFEYLP